MRVGGQVRASCRLTNRSDHKGEGVMKACLLDAYGTQTMRTILACSQARRRLRRLLVLVGEGHTFVITKNGHAMCQLGDSKVRDRPSHLA